MRNGSFRCSKYARTAAAVASTPSYGGFRKPQLNGSAGTPQHAIATAPRSRNSPRSENAMKTRFASRKLQSGPDNTRAPLHRPARREHPLELEAVGVGEEDGAVAGRVLRIVGRRVEDRDAERDELRVHRVDRLARGRGEGEVVEAGRGAVVRGTRAGRDQPELERSARPDRPLRHVLAAAEAEQRQHAFIERGRAREVAH